MRAADALQIERELQKEIPAEFYTTPVKKEDGKDRAAYDAMKAVQRYRHFLLAIEAGVQEDLDCRHDVCGQCGANLDAGEVCDCRKVR